MAINTLTHGPIVCVPDDRLTTIDSTLSTYTEQDYEYMVTPAGSNFADVSGVPPCKPVATGNPTESLDVTLNVVNPGQVDAQGAYTYQKDGVTYGQTGAWVCVGAETIATDSAGNHYRPNVVALPDGAVLCMYEDWTTTPGRVKTKRRDPDTELWSVAQTLWTANIVFTIGHAPNPALWWEPSNDSLGYRVYCATFQERTLNEITLRVDISKDGGVTWTDSAYSNLVLDVSVSNYSLSRIAWDELSQTLRLVIQQSSGGVYTGLTYQSLDRGMTWEYLSGADIADMRRCDLIAWGGKFYLTTVDGANNADTYEGVTLNSSWNMVNETWGSNASTQDLAQCVDATGTLWTWTRDASTTENMLLEFASSNGGATWGIPSRYPYEATGLYNYEPVIIDHAAGALTSGIRAESACYAQGQYHVVGRFESSGTTRDDSIYSLIFARVEYLTRKASPLENIARIWDTYYPIDIPSTKSAQYTYTGAAGESITTDAQGEIVHYIDATAGQGFYTQSTGGTNHTEQSAHWIVSRDSTDGSTTAADAVMECHADETTTNTYCGLQLRIDFTNRTVRAYDKVGGIDLSGVDISWAAGDDVEFFIDVSRSYLRGSAWVRNRHARTWTTIVSNGVLTSAAGNTNTTVFGKRKTLAGAINIYTLFFRPGPSEGYYDGFHDRRGLLATGTPDYLPIGAHVQWQGSPLMVADQWTLSTISRAPIQRVSPFAAIPSPSRQYLTGTGAAGRTELIAYDLGANFDAPLGWNLLYLAAGNVRGLENIRLRYRSGGAWVTEFTVSLAWIPFGLPGTVGWQRNGHSIRPWGVNGPQRIFRENELAGWMGVVDDGVGGIVYAEIVRNSPGQFPVASGSRQMDIEFSAEPEPGSPSNWAALAANSWTGSITLYPSYVVGIGAATHETQQYYAIEYDLHAYATEASIGHLSTGRAHWLARQERAGGSIEYINADELTVIPGSGQMRGRRVRAKQTRILTLPFDGVLVPLGRWEDGYTVSTVAADGITPRANIDNNLDILEGLNDYAGQRMPVWVVPDAQFTADPGATVQVFYGTETFLGFIDNFTRVAARGQVIGRGSYHTHGGQLVLRETP